MRRRFRNLAIQGKLFAVFGTFILLAAVVVGIKIYSILQVAEGNVRLEQAFANLVASYDAQVLVQQLETAEQGLFVNDDVYALDALTEHSTRLDTFIRETQLKAESNEAKAAIYQLQQVKQQHDETIAMLSDAVYEEDEAAFNENLDGASDEIAAMYEVMDTLIARDYQTMEAIDVQTTTLQYLGLGLSATALVIFVGLAVIAALIVSSHILGPVIVINDATASLRAGTFDPQQLAPYAHREDEIGNLARAFLTMAEAVEQRRASLDQEAEELQAHLAA